MPELSLPITGLSMHRLATRLRTHLHSRTRGQSLVEFALVLPIIMMLTLTALDFGRVYLGYINLQNMSRIAANFAANNPTAWIVSADPIIQAKHNEAKTQYQNEILGDAAASNCNLPLVAGVQTVPAPTFTDANGNGTPEIGDTAQVGISCTFGVITPVISNIVGGSVAVSAFSKFPVKSGMTASMGAAPVGTAPNAAFSANNSIYAPNTINGSTPFTVTFVDSSGGNPTSWLWNFNDGSPTTTVQDPPAHQFASGGNYVVSLTASNAWGSTTAYMTVHVIDPTTVDFTINQPSLTAPSAVTFTSTSSPGGTNYAWTFGAGQGSASGASMTTANHTYNTAATYSVMLTVTYPSGPVSVTKSVGVGAALCQVPKLSGVKRNVAQATWNVAGFSGTVNDGPGAPNGNGWTILSQSQVYPSNVACTSSVVVNNP
jgi:PKD repeat protein